MFSFLSNIHEKCQIITWESKVLLRPRVNYIIFFTIRMSSQCKLTGTGVAVQGNISIFFLFVLIFSDYLEYATMLKITLVRFFVNLQFKMKLKAKSSFSSLRIGHYSWVLLQYLFYCSIIDFCRRWPDFQGLLLKRLGLSIFQAAYFKSCEIRFLPIRNQVKNIN